MATPLDTKLIPKVLAVVNKYGKLVDFKVPASKTYDPTTGATTEGEEATHQHKVTPPGWYKETLIPKDLIQQGDLMAILPASGLGFTPTRGYRVEFDSMKFRIEHVAPLYSGDSVAAYELLLRH